MAKQDSKAFIEQATNQALQLLKRTPGQHPVLSDAAPGTAEKDINEEIIRERKLKNDDTEQDIRLKKITLDRLFWFLAIETTLIFVFALLQGTYWLGFVLEDWSFRLLVTATIAQITGMLFVAVRYLFPKGKV